MSDEHGWVDPRSDHSFEHNVNHIAHELDYPDIHDPDVDFDHAFVHYPVFFHDDSTHGDFSKIHGSSDSGVWIQVGHDV